MIRHAPARHRRISSLLAGVLSIALVLAGAPAARGADAARARAKRHNARARKLFSLGMFKKAAVEYKRAYEAKPVAAFLFNLGQCYKRIDTVADQRQAIFYFKSYLNNASFSPIATKVKEEIDKARARIAELERPPPFYKRWWFWTIIGAAVAGAATGTAIALQPTDQEPPVTDAQFETPQ